MLRGCYLDLVRDHGFNQAVQLGVLLVEAGVHLLGQVLHVLAQVLTPQGIPLLAEALILLIMASATAKPGQRTTVAATWVVFTVAGSTQATTWMLCR